MGLVFALKGAELTKGKGKMLTMPEVEMTVHFEERGLGKMTPDERGEFDKQFEKMFKAKSTPVIDAAIRKMRDWEQQADSAIPNEDEKQAAARVATVQKEVERLCKVLLADLKKCCAGSVWAAYTIAMKVKMTSAVEVGGEVTSSGKVELSSAASSGIQEAANMQELAGRLLTGVLFPAEGDIEGVVGESQRAGPLLDKSIKECTVLSKAMKEQQKKETKEGEKLIKATMSSLDKNLDVLEKLVSASQTRTRQAKLKLAKLDAATKPMKDAGISGDIRQCIGSAQHVLDLLNTFHALKPVMDQVAKPYDGETVPDFGKLSAMLHKLHDPKPSKALSDGVGKLGEKLVLFSKQ